MVKELEIKNYFERLGYISARSAGSHSLLDVFCIPRDKKKPILGIQVKRSKLGIKDISKHFEEVDALKTDAFPENVVIELWLYIDFEGYKVYRLKNNEFNLVQSFKNINEYTIPVM